MSKIEELIQQYCPDGVEWKNFFDVCDLIRGITYNKAQEAKSTYNAHKVLRANNITLHLNTLNFEDVKLVSNDVVVKAAQQLYSGDILMCAGSGSKEHVGKVAYIKEDMDYTFGGFMAVVRCKSCITPRFMFHILTGNIFSKHLEREIKSTTINNINKQVMQSLEIPLPPLPVQEEIVRILDTFTELQAELQKELEAELQARQQQYQFYRDKLFAFDDRTDIKYKKLSEVASIKTGRRFVRTDIKESGVPCFHYGDIYTYYGLTATKTKGYLDAELASKLRFAQPNDVVVVCAGENDMDLGIGVAWLGDEPAVVHDACCILHHEQNPRYISHFLRTHKYHLQMKRYAKNGKISSLSSKSLGEAIIPIPSLEEQERIATTLDRFDSLVNDLSKGLPAEIEARKQQYEYYRDKLLTFKKKA